VKKKNKPQVKVPIIPKISTKKKRVPSHLGFLNLEDGHISWRFSRTDLAGPFKCNDLSFGEFQQLWQRLKAFESKNLAEIIDTGSHPIPIPDFSKEARDRLMEIGLDDLEELWSFRIDSTCRLYCFKEDNIFALLWWDTKHRACPAGKSHT
jgi:hypothetical protein